VLERPEETAMLRLLRTLVRLKWPIRLLNPLLGRFNPLLPEYHVDPYPFYRALRSSAPAYFSPAFRVWVLSRYRDIVEVLRSPRFSVERGRAEIPSFLNPFGGISEEFARTIGRSLLMVDPPDHTRLRGLVNKAFTPRMVERLEPRIQEIVDSLLGAAARAGGLDVVRDLAFPLPVIVIAEMLGVPPEDRDRFRRWSNDLAVLLDPFTGERDLGDAQDAFEELGEYFRHIFEQRRREPRSDLMSALVAAEESGERLDSTELLANCSLLLGAGHETTSNLIGNACVALLRNPGERKRLQDDPSLMRSAVEEFLRFDSPVQATDRVASEDCEIDGARVRKGQFVVLLLGSANRDPEQFEAPDRLDVGRRENRHLAFGHGAHFCLGAPLARLEARVALETLLRRFPRFDGGPDPSGWRPSMILRGPTALRISLA
jgi:hypothetical protein